jgi:hypothetical protein
VVSALPCAIAEVKQHWSVMRLGDQKLSRAPLCFGRNVNPLVSALFTIVSTNQSALCPRDGLWTVLLCVIHKEGLCPSSEDINRLMMMMSHR